MDKLLKMVTHSYHNRQQPLPWPYPLPCPCYRYPCCVHALQGLSDWVWRKCTGVFPMYSYARIKHELPTCFTNVLYIEFWSSLKQTLTCCITLIKSTGLSFPSIIEGSRPSPPYLNWTMNSSEFRTVPSYCEQRSSKDYKATDYNNSSTTTITTTITLQQ